MPLLKTVLRKRRRRLIKQPRVVSILDEANSLFLSPLERRAEAHDRLLSYARTGSMTPKDRRKRVKRAERAYAKFLEENGAALERERAERIARDRALFEAGRGRRRHVVVGYQRPVSAANG